MGEGGRREGGRGGEEGTEGQRSADTKGCLLTLKSGFNIEPLAPTPIHELGFLGHVISLLGIFALLITPQST